MGEGKISHRVQIDDFENDEHVLETHEQVTMRVEQYIELLEKAHFKHIEYYSDFKTYNENDDRVIFVVKK